MKKVPGHDGLALISFAQDLTQPPLFAFFGWENIEAMAFRRRSWSWQTAHLPRAVQHWQPATRMLTTSDATPLITVVAELTWLDFDSTTVKFVCKHAGKFSDFPSGCTLLEVLLHATMKVLKIDEDGALTVLKQRMLKPKRADDEGNKALLEIVEAMKCVEPTDQEVLQTEQKQLFRMQQPIQSLLMNGQRKDRQPETSQASLPSRRRPRLALLRRQCCQPILMAWTRQM